MSAGGRLADVVRQALPLAAALGLLAGTPGSLAATSAAEGADRRGAVEYTVRPVGWVRKAGGRSWIEIESRYPAAMMGLDQFATLQVLYWFDRNDTPEKRAILQVHPHGNPDHPLRGVFATRSPFRPNLIALSTVKVIAVKGNLIEIDDIDAFADTPVLDIKP